MKIIKNFRPFIINEALKGNHILLTEALPYSLAKEYTSLKRNPAIVERMDKIFKKLEDLQGASISKNGNRVYLPFEEELQSPVKSEIEEVFKDTGFSIKDYKLGLAIDPYNREIKINKALMKIGRQDLVNKVNTDKHRTDAPKGENLVIVFSKHPYDIAGMSTDRGWTSCMNLYDGVNKHYIQHDVIEGSIVCYLINSDDRNIKTPISRIVIKPFVNLDNQRGVLYYPEAKEYGKAPAGFMKQVKKIVETVQGGKTSSPLKLVSTLYCDSHRIIWDSELMKRPAKTREEVKKIMDIFLSAMHKHNLVDAKPWAQKYTINDDLTVDVNGTFAIDIKLLDRLTVQFGKIDGDFYALGCKLKSLEGFPREVTGSVFIQGNDLTDLQGAPTIVGGIFLCAENQLKSLKGAPLEVKSFNCESNRLTSLEGGPKTVYEFYDCSNNRLVNLKGAPEKVDGNFICKSNQLTSLEGGPKEVGGGFDCHSNQLTSLEGGPSVVESNYNCANNKLTSLKGAPRIIKFYFSCMFNQLSDLIGSPEIVEGSFGCGSNKITSLRGGPREVGEIFYCSKNPVSEEEKRWAEENIKADGFVWEVPEEIKKAARDHFGIEESMRNGKGSRLINLGKRSNTIPLEKGLYDITDSPMIFSKKKGKKKVSGEWASWMKRGLGPKGIKMKNVPGWNKIKSFNEWKKR